MASRINLSLLFFSAQANDTEEKCQELQKAVEKLQSLLREATDRFGNLEQSYDEEKAEHKEDVRRRNEAILGLKKELEDANVLIKTLQDKGKVDGWADLKVASCYGLIF